MAASFAALAHQPAGYDMTTFWLVRFLMARGIECLVIDPGSLQINRRGRYN
jgi:transposase